MASHTPDYEIIVNVQGDEPLIDPDVIDRLAQDLIDHPKLDMATVATPLHEDEYDDPSSVKVVVNQKGEDGVLRAAPCPRDGLQDRGHRCEDTGYRH